MVKRIVVAGSVLVDRINEIAAYPTAGELTQIRRISRAPGGCVPNTAIDIRRLAPEIPVVAAGAVGGDDDGVFVRDAMATEGIDVSGLAVSGERTSFTDVMSVPGGERTFFTYPGASAAWGLGDVRFDTLNAGDMFHLGYFLLLDRVDNGDGLEILRELKRRSVTTSIDLVSENSDRYRLVRPCLPYVDNLIVNETEAAKLAGIEGDSAALTAALKELGVRDRVIIHEPKKGACRSASGYLEVPSVPIPKSAIVGKTGAGDAFCAGCLCGIWRGLGDREILDLGAVAAVGAMTAPGATEGMRTERELRDYLKGILNHAG